jgi:uncharacterized repeat protein (TIGR03847 family)
MPRRRYLFDPPERFVVGAIGPPGQRTFFLQARDGDRLISVVLEKIQVVMLAERLEQLLDELMEQGVVTTAEHAAGDDTDPLDEPLVEAFRAGSLTLGWDGSVDEVMIEARAEDAEDEAVDPDEDDDAEDGPDLLRVLIDAATARSFIARAARVVAGGRPPCPLCGNPLDPHGHLCPRRNGHFLN